MSILSVDVETVPDEDKLELHKRLVPWLPSETKPDETEEQWRTKEMSLTPEYCRLVGLNLMEDGLEPTSHWVGETVKSAMFPEKTRVLTETDLLRKFWKLAAENGTIIGYNILDFDLQVIRVRSAILGIQTNGVDLVNLKPWETRVVDLMKRYFGGRKVMGLKKLRLLLWEQMVKFCPEVEGYKDILAMEGDEVAGLYETKSFTVLKRYGEFDSLTNIALYRLGKGLWW